MYWRSIYQMLKTGHCLRSLLPGIRLPRLLNSMRVLGAYSFMLLELSVAELALAKLTFFSIDAFVSIFVQLIFRKLPWMLPRFVFSKLNRITPWFLMLHLQAKVIVTVDWYAIALLTR